MKILAVILVHVLGALAKKQDSYDNVFHAKSRFLGSHLRHNVKLKETRSDDTQKSAGLIQYKAATSDTVLMASELKEAKLQLVHATSAAKTETANSMHLKIEVTKAMKMQKNLRARLQQMSNETRASLAMLLKQLEVAKAAAQRSEAMLQEEIKEESAKLKVAEVSQLALRNQLASAETSAAIASRSLADVTAKAATQQAVDRKALETMSAELKSSQVSSQRAIAALNEKLAQMQRTDAKEQSKLEEKVNATRDAAVKEKTQMESRLKELSKSAEKTQDNLDAERFTEKILMNNVTSMKEESELAAAKARKERMGLLVQVSDLQGQAATAQQRAASAMNSSKSTEEAADKKIKELSTEADRQGKEREQRMSALLQETEIAHANLTTAANAAKLSQLKISDLQATVSREGEQLRVALLESDSLKSARDAALKGQAAFQRMDTLAETSLNASRQELVSAEKELQAVKQELATHLNDASILSSKCKTLQTQLATLQQTSATEQAKIKQQTHDSMISAAAKVHELEDQNEQLSDDLEKEKQELKVAAAESAKAKDTLMQQTDASLKASQHAESLQTKVDQIQKEVVANNAHVQDLSRQTTALRDERDRSKAATLAKSASQTELQAHIEALEAAKEADHSRIAKIEAEDKNLKTQVHDLSGEESRADELEEELATLRQSMQRKDTEESQMAKKLEMLRTLKDHYSSDNEEVKKETVEWQQKAEDLEEQLKSAKHRLAKMSRQREKALLRAKQARSQEDEYFEENAHLQQQDEALNAQLTEIGATSNHTAEENSLLQEKVDELSNEEKREKDNSKAAMEENKMELQQAREDLKESQGKNDDIKAELLRMQAVLSDKERRALGLPPLKMLSAKPAAVVSSTLAPVAAAASPKVVTKQLTKDAKSTNDEKASLPKAKALTQLPGEPARPLDDAAATLASVTNPKPASSRSALQKLTDFFAAPLPAPLPR